MKFNKILNETAIIRRLILDKKLYRKMHKNT